MKDMKKSDIITTDGYLSFCRESQICYIKTDYFYTGGFIWRGEYHPDRIDDICVVGHSDYSVTNEISNRFKMVFCINRECDNINTFGLPLGITNDSGESELHNIYGNTDIIIDIISENIKKECLAYINFNIKTFPKERNFVFDKFSKEDWVEVGEIENTLDGRKRFLREIKKSKFVFCPRGNGIDTHRLWETLYMGSIPIVKYEESHHLFTDLPILFIKDWNDVSQDFLNEKYNEIISKNWNMEKLKLSYWLQFINKKINENEN
jgi:hypothetical protein